MVSVVELFAWGYYMVGDEEFARFYFSGMGYYGSVIAYAFPMVFSIVHLSVTLGGNNNGFPGAYTLYLMIGQILMWLVCGILHIVYVPEFEAYVALVNRQKYVIKEVIPADVVDVTVADVVVERPGADDPITIEVDTSVDVDVDAIVDEVSAGDGW